MNAQTQTAGTKTHPLVLAAAGGVLVASLAVAGVATGLIKTGSNTPEQPTAAELAGNDASTGGAGAAPVTAPVQQRAAAAPVKASQAPARTVVAAATPAPVVAPCRNCGEVINVEAIRRQGEGSGLGAVAGGLAGALLGKQIGNGNGQKVATVAGAIGGAYAGNQIEKNAKADTDYRVTVRFTDGTTQSFNFDEQPAWRVGDDVRVDNGRIAAR